MEILGRDGAGLVVRADSEADTGDLGAALARRARPGLVVGLIGPLGAGKTRLVRAFAEALGADPGAVSSPTFVLIHEYEARLPIYHVDTYRLRAPDEFDELGMLDYYAAGGVCLIEWADRVIDRLPPGAWMVRIEPVGPSSREVRLEMPADEGQALLEDLQGSGEGGPQAG